MFTMKLVSCHSCAPAPVTRRSAPFQRQTAAPQHLRHGVITKSAESAAAAEVPSDEKLKRTGFFRGARDLFNPFDDKKANARFLALALGGLLCSIATLIHDSYLPVFMRDELGMTNTVCWSFVCPWMLGTTKQRRLAFRAFRSFMHGLCTFERDHNRKQR
jgi:hypothetical protein